MNAYDFRPEGRREQSKEHEVSELTGLGLHVTELDLRQYFARQGDLSSAIGEFDALYIRGGSVFVLRRALAHSGADKIVAELVAADTLVYAGYSAAACLLGSTLRGIAGHIDDPLVIPAGYPPGPTLWDGLGLLPFAIAPHYRSDHPESEEIEQTVTRFIDGHVPFVALRDGETLIVDGSVTEVVA